MKLTCLGVVAFLLFAVGGVFAFLAFQHYSWARGFGYSSSRATGEIVLPLILMGISWLGALMAGIGLILAAIQQERRR